MPVPKLVGDIMTREITTLPHDAKLLDAVLLMRSSGFRHMPVVNGDRLVGLLSDRDVQRASPSIFGKMSPEEYNRIFETTPIEKVMARDPVAVKPDAPITEVVKLMHERKFGSVPVVEGDNKLVGIVTTTDLLALLSNVLGGA
ncbi:MAG: CBS domain-containing protein [Acidobacteria bacterium]|nr:CBS domain-containing protein [Acidobacteriota bacterium]